MAAGWGSETSGGILRWCEDTAVYVGEGFRVQSLGVGPNVKIGFRVKDRNKRESPLIQPRPATTSQPYCHTYHPPSDQTVKQTTTSLILGIRVTLVYPRYSCPGHQSDSDRLVDSSLSNALHDEVWYTLQVRAQ